MYIITAIFVTIISTITSSGARDVNDTWSISVDRMRMIARITNGIYLQRGLIDGTIPVDELIAELLGIQSVDQMLKVDTRKVIRVFERLNSTNDTSLKDLHLMITLLTQTPTVPLAIKHSLGFPNGYRDLLTLQEDFKDPWILEVVRTRSLSYSMAKLEKLGIALKNISWMLEVTKEEREMLSALVKNPPEFKAPLSKLVVTGLQITSNFQEAQNALRALRNILFSMKHSRSLESDALTHLLDPFRHSEVLGLATQGVVSMKQVLDKKSRFQEVIPYLEVVKEKIRNSSLSQKDLSNLKALAALQTSLEAMYQSLETWRDSLTDSNSSTLNNYTTLFENAKNVTGIPLNFTEISDSLDQLIQETSNETTREQLEDLEAVVNEMNTIGLNFSKYSKNFEETNETMQALNLFFESYESKVYEPILASRNSDYTVMFSLIGVGVAMFIIVFILGLCYLWRADKEIKMDEEKQKKKNKKSINGASRSNSEVSPLTAGVSSGSKTTTSSSTTG
ncbi:hypothetical protein GCK72_021780 [Caenorhabditis remanei]|uniref:Domain of unknown function WSN domain-containing protein n=1 Tax=Caenorhabditis remanei TaxID=31234 RepID=A0A6A5GKU8_CAERE|nr:hypothetical protein GCK72_021780 [Caenorhabditis remanei]KAF1755211.1 hypothetical protein GCK72_021780 [Caenorhabditis remanei]